MANSPPSSTDELRPRDLATVLLASGDLLPRQRARDQQADRAGAELKTRILTRLAEFDPEAGELETALERIVHEIGEPTGPTRAVAQTILEEFSYARAHPGIWEWLLSRALQQRSSTAVQGEYTNPTRQRGV